MVGPRHRPVQELDSSSALGHPQTAVAWEAWSRHRASEEVAEVWLLLLVQSLPPGSSFRLP